MQLLKLQVEKKHRQKHPVFEHRKNRIPKHRVHKDRKNTRRFKVRQHRQHVPEEVKKHRVTQETIMHREAMSVRIMKNAVNTATMKADRIIKTTERNTGMTVRTTEVI